MDGQLNREEVEGDIDAAVRRALVLARETARDEDVAMVVGWWQENEKAQLMVVPVEHDCTGRFAFTPIMLVLPEGSFVPLMKVATELN